MQILLAAFLVMGALPKLTAAPESVASFEMVGAGQWLRPFVGLAEVAGAIGLLIPAMSRLAALRLAVMTVGLLITFVGVAWGRSGLDASTTHTLPGARGAH